MSVAVKLLQKKRKQKYHVLDEYNSYDKLLINDDYLISLNLCTFELKYKHCIARSSRWTYKLETRLIHDDDEFLVFFIRKIHQYPIKPSYFPIISENDIVTFYKTESYPFYIYQVNDYFLPIVKHLNMRLFYKTGQMKRIINIRELPVELCYEIASYL